MKNPILQNPDSLLFLKCGAGEWTNTNTISKCNQCGHSYPINDGHLFTTENYITEQKWEETNNRFLPLIGGSPAVNKLGGPRIGDLVSKLGIDGLTINLVSGQDNLSEGHVNVDLGNYKPIHVVADLRNLPFNDKSISLILSNSVLEHIFDYNNMFP